MKIRFAIEDYKPKLIIKYTDEEIEKLTNLFKNLGLKISETEKGFGNQKLKYYREEKEEVLKYLEKTISDYSKFDFIDNINSDLINNYEQINIAILRVVPDNNNETVINLPKYLTIKEFDILITKIHKLYSLLFNIVPNNTEIEIQVKEKGGDKK